MCANCSSADGCECTGGFVFASCRCEEGGDCPVCGHEAVASVITEALLAPEILSIDMLEFDSE